ncbi:23S rRNA (adenine(2030)-N(6))-methyltransferase RlmJ [Salmonella enterica subsp. enterica]|nr:23S rRNA (adenine(2030)-N(6))-methyltransferase RlmJ [Salmonella enterica subsp. enterica]
MLRYYPAPLIARQLLQVSIGQSATHGIASQRLPPLRAEFQQDNRARVERADGYQQTKPNYRRLPAASGSSLPL